MRKQLLFIHRWLGLTAGTVFGIAAFTGAVLVYDVEIDRLLTGSPRLETTEGEIGPGVVDSILAVSFPGARLTYAEWPSAAANVYRLDLDDAGVRRSVMLDAGSGRQIEVRRFHVVLRGFVGLHAALLMGRPGSLVVYYATAAATVSLFLGLILWWPGLRHLARGFRLRLGRGLYILNFDAHNVIGVIALAPVLLMAVTGLLLEHPGAVERLERLVHGENAGIEAPRSSLPAGGAAAPGLAILARNAAAAAGDGSIVRIRFPSEPDGAVEVRIRRDGPSRDSVFVSLDRHSGEVLAARPVSGPRFRLTPESNARLHMAKFGHPAIRLAYALSCLAAALLLPTGALLWWLKKRRTKRP